MLHLQTEATTARTMSNIKVKELYAGEWVSAQQLADGQSLDRPIYVKHWLNGSYMSLRDVRKLAAEFNAAIDALIAAGVAERS